MTTGNSSPLTVCLLVVRMTPSLPSGGPRTVQRDTAGEIRAVCTYSGMLSTKERKEPRDPTNTRDRPGRPRTGRHRSWHRLGHAVALVRHGQRVRGAAA